MANAVRWSSRICLNVLNDNLKKRIIFNAITRTLYSETDLLLDNYKSTRNALVKSCKSDLIKYKMKIAKSMDDEKCRVKLGNLTTFFYIMEKSPEDITLLFNIVDKLNNQKDDVARYKFHKLGPSVMRVLHYLKEPDIAFKMITNPKFNGFFDVLSHIILMDLLYESSRYGQVRQIYDIVKDTTMWKKRYVLKLVADMIVVSCYKENTQESLAYGLQFHKNLSDLKTISTKRIIAALGALALHQKAPDVTLELVNLSKISEYMPHLCLKIMALADLNRLDDVEKEFRFVLDYGDPRTYFFYREIIPKVKNAIKRSAVGDNTKVCRLFKEIQTKGYIRNLTTDQQLSTPINI